MFAVQLKPWREYLVQVQPSLFTLSSTYTLQITGSLGHTESARMLAVTTLVEPFEWPAAAVVKENCVGVIDNYESLE